MLLKNATIINGLNQPRFLGHILIQDDKITAIVQNESDLPLHNEAIIDCQGLTVSPGFIDAHTHQDFFAGKVDNDIYFNPFVLQGVTTMIAGNCGFSAAGYMKNSPYNDQVGGGLFSNDGNDYSSFQTWSEKIDKNIPVNLVSLVGHGTSRIGVNGKQNTPLTENQIQIMEESIEQALQEGAAGVSLGLMYEPGQFAPFEELERIAKIVKKHNKILTVHARACSKVSTSYQPPVGGRAHNLRAMDEVATIVRNTGVKLEYSHLIFVGKSSWSTVDESLEILDNLKKEGFDVGFDLYPMEFGASVITVVLPVWYLGMDSAKRKKWTTKLRLWLEIFIATKALGFGFEDILISNTYGKLKEVEGYRVTEIAKKRKKSAFATYLELIDQTNGRINVLMYKYQNPEIIEQLRNHPLSIYMSDAWIEKDSGVQNFACYYTFPKFITLARDHQTSIEQAIHKMTYQTAQRFQIPARGAIQEGYFADLVLFDLQELDFIEGKDLPPVGIKYVINNGKIVMKNGAILPEVSQQIGRFIPIP